MISPAQNLANILGQILDAPQGQRLEIPEGLGSAICTFFKVLPARGNDGYVVPVKFVYNIHTGLPTDLPLGHSSTSPHYS